MARILEDEQESEDAICPCCGQPLLIEVNVAALPDGGLVVNYIKLAHKGTAAADAIGAEAARLPRR